jgi:hypothetical protein
MADEIQIGSTVTVTPDWTNDPETTEQQTVSEESQNGWVVVWMRKYEGDESISKVIQNGSVTAAGKVCETDGQYGKWYPQVSRLYVNGTYLSDLYKRQATASAARTTWVTDPDDDDGVDGTQPDAAIGNAYNGDAGPRKGWIEPIISWSRGDVQPCCWCIYPVIGGPCGGTGGTPDGECSEYTP